MLKREFCHRIYLTFSMIKQEDLVNVLQGPIFSYNKISEMKYCLLQEIISPVD